MFSLLFYLFRKDVCLDCVRKQVLETKAKNAFVLKEWYNIFFLLLVYDNRIFNIFSCIFIVKYLNDFFKIKYDIYIERDMYKFIRDICKYGLLYHTIVLLFKYS